MPTVGGICKTCQKLVRLLTNQTVEAHKFREDQCPGSYTYPMQRVVRAEV